VLELYGKSAAWDNKVRVKTVDDQILEFDEVVTTTPLGWLKQNQHAFYPPLPDRLAQAIRNIGYGCLEKVGTRINQLYLKLTPPGLYLLS